MKKYWAIMKLSAYLWMRTLKVPTKRKFRKRFSRHYCRTTAIRALSGSGSGQSWWISMAATAAIRLLVYCSARLQDCPLPVCDLCTNRLTGLSRNGSARGAVGRVSSGVGWRCCLLGAGLYGVVAQGVARRTNEIGAWRLAAQRGNILWMVFARYAFALLIGLAVGIPALWEHPILYRRVSIVWTSFHGRSIIFDGNCDPPRGHGACRIFARAPRF